MAGQLRRAQAQVRRVEEVHDSLAATFALAWTTWTPLTADCTCLSAIFKEDEPTPAVAIGKLWSALDGAGPTRRTICWTILLRERFCSAAGRMATPYRPRSPARLHGHELGDYGCIAAHPSSLDAYRELSRATAGILRLTTATSTTTWPTTWINWLTMTPQPKPSSRPLRRSAWLTPASPSPATCTMATWPTWTSPGTASHVAAHYQIDAEPGTICPGRLRALCPDPHQHQLACVEL